MQTSRFPLSTLKETPSDAETISHQLMLRAGMIRQVAAGLYNWLPLGLRTLRKVEAIVRREMDRSGALELLMPAVQPAGLWRESGRWEQYGPELLRLTDRHERDFCIGPTHEEVITALVRDEIRSYRQLPVNYYQIQTKFRDEVRPRFGVMRSREFLMKDAYSFHLEEQSLQRTYTDMYDAYARIFSRAGLAFRAVEAHGGSIGGQRSHEFHVLAESGEDAIAFSAEGGFAANVELVKAPPPTRPRPQPARALAAVDTPGQHTIAELCGYLDIAPEQTVKTLLVAGEGETLAALVLRGDHTLNAVKAARLEQVAEPLTLASARQVLEATGCEPGSVGPAGLSFPVIADHSAARLADFACGANQPGKHLIGVNWGRDLAEPEVADLRNVAQGDPSPDGKGALNIARGIEVGHIFQLGTKYSDAMNASVLDENGRMRPLIMGCYGIGIGRVVAAAIEQNHDRRGIIWPEAIAPFQAALTPINMHKSARLREAAHQLYRELRETGLEVLFDDRPLRPGVMFADMDLIGIPHRVVLSERGLDAGVVEYRQRREEVSRDWALADIVELLRPGRLETGAGQGVQTMRKP